VLILSYENEISLTCKLNSFSYERMSTKTRFEEEAKGNSEMVYFFIITSRVNCHTTYFLIKLIFLKVKLSVHFLIHLHVTLCGKNTVIYGFR